jgi:branched-chain amino acid transport system ATP-binding protein
VEAIKGLSFAIAEGAIVSLIGANGAGKTTCLRALTGLVQPSGGEVRFEGTSLVGLAPHQIVRLGIAHVPEGRRLFPKMTVRENLRMGAYIRARQSEVASTLEMIYAHFPILRERGRQLAGSLSGGEQQMLAIARALMNRPRLLLLDEPSMGLSPIMTAEIGKIVRQINALDVSIVLVEQNAMLALTLAQYGYVLEVGSLVMQGKAEELLRDEPGALDEGLELGPHDGWVLALEEGALGEPAVGAGHDPLPADQPGVGHEALGHCLGVLDHRGRVGDDPGNEQLALGQLDVLPHAPFMRVADIGGLN